MVTTTVARNPFDTVGTASALSMIFDRVKEDSYIGIGVASHDSENPTWPQTSFVVQAGELETMIPAIRDHVVNTAGKTGYFSPATFKTTALTRGVYAQYKEAHLQGKTRTYLARQKYVRELPALMLDLDVGRPNTPSTGQALGVLVDAEMRGEIPAPALYAYSGRGLYVLWLLQDEDGHAPVNTPENRKLWRLVMDGLIRKTLGLEPDPGSKDFKAWRKLPETKTHSGATVRYLLFGAGEPTGEITIPRYQLDELVEFLELPRVVTPQQVQSPPPVPAQYEPLIAAGDTSSPAVRKGAARTEGSPSSPNEKRVREVEAIAHHRGGIRVGHRHRALFHLFNSRRGWLVTVFRDENRPHAVRDALRQAWHELVEFNAKWCRPPMMESELRATASKLTGRRYWPQSSTVAAHLGVTEAEVEALGLEMVVPAAVQERIDKFVAERRREKDEVRRAVDERLIAGESRRKIAAELGVKESLVRSRQRILTRNGRLPSRQEELL